MQQPPAPQTKVVHAPRPAVSIELGLMVALLGLVMISMVTALGSSVNTNFEPATENLRSHY